LLVYYSVFDNTEVYIQLPELDNTEVYNQFSEFDNTEVYIQLPVFDNTEVYIQLSGNTEGQGYKGHLVDRLVQSLVELGSMALTVHLVTVYLMLVYHT
jgi:hypothetical protein